MPSGFGKGQESPFHFVGNQHVLPFRSVKIGLLKMLLTVQMKKFPVGQIDMSVERLTDDDFLRIAEEEITHSETVTTENLINNGRAIEIIGYQAGVESSAEKLRSLGFPEAAAALWRGEATLLGDEEGFEDHAS